MSRITTVTPQSDLLETVYSLWRTNSDTLGFMPRGGFDHAAQRATLLAAVRHKTLLGYVLFRLARDHRASIAHLCVAPNCRGQGVARLLFDGVRDRAIRNGCCDITLRCRRDFEANRLWPRLGFFPVTDAAGRATNSVLTSWRYELAELPLLRRMTPPSLGVTAVIDANVFLDLDDESQGGVESAGLRADWLTEFIELRITDELFTEINRQNNSEERERQRRRARLFPTVHTASAREREVLPKIAMLLGAGSSASAESDARQLAKAVAAGVPFFVSRDKNMLAAASELFHEFGLRVVQPHELIVHFDELRREADYRPQRLGLGAATTARAPRPADLAALVELVHGGQTLHEPRKQTKARLRQLMSAPDQQPGTYVTHNGKALAAYFITRPAPGELHISFFAVTADPLGPTAARHYIDHIVHVAAREGRQIIRFLGTPGRIDDALEHAGFSWENGGWLRLSLNQIGDSASVERSLRAISEQCPAAADLAKRIAARLQPTTPVELAKTERLLWPAKILGTQLPCFVVPIKPKWAKELFDEVLARGTLFGAQPDLVMNSENVYYRAAKPAMPTAPSRVLWYVSGDAKYPDAMAIRACSYVDEVMVGSPKDVFRPCRRLGVYQWQDVLETAKSDPAKHVLAFRFSKTEQFGTPVGWETIQRVLQAHRGSGSQFQGPLEVSEACFLQLYELGTRGTHDVA